MGRGKGNLTATLHIRLPAELKARFKRAVARERKRSGTKGSDLLRRMMYEWVEKRELEEKAKENGR